MRVAPHDEAVQSVVELDILKATVHRDLESLDKVAHLSAQILLPSLVLFKVFENGSPVLVSDESTFPLGVHLHCHEAVQTEVAVLKFVFLQDLLFVNDKVHDEVFELVDVHHAGCRRVIRPPILHVTIEGLFSDSDGLLSGGSCETFQDNGDEEVQEDQTHD